MSPISLAFPLKENLNIIMSLVTGPNIPLFPIYFNSLMQGNLFPLFFSPLLYVHITIPSYSKIPYNINAVFYKSVEYIW